MTRTASPAEVKAVTALTATLNHILDMHGVPPHAKMSVAVMLFIDALTEQAHLNDFDNAILNVQATLEKLRVLSTATSVTDLEQKTTLISDAPTSKD